MPRGKSTKADEKALAFFSELLGQDLTEKFVEEKSKVVEPPDVKVLQAEGVLLHLQSAAKALLHKKCKECGELFATRYFAVAYCSTQCRAKTLQRDFGVSYNSRTDHYSNMEAERPLIVGPQAYQTLLEFAHRFLEQHDFVVSQPDDKPLDEDHNHDPHTTPEFSLPQLDVPLESPPSLDSLPENPFESSPFG